MAKKKYQYSSSNKSVNYDRLKLRLGIAAVAALVVLFAVIMRSSSSSTQMRDFNKIRKTTEGIFKKEMEYFNKWGRFSADLKKIDLPLPPKDETAPNEYERAHYEYDPNQGYYYVGESLMYYTKSGDHYWITISEEQLSDVSENPPINYFAVTGFGKNLPVAFKKAYGYGKEFQRQFSRPQSPEIEYLCYSVGPKFQPKRAAQICQKSGLPFEVITVETPPVK